MSASHQEDDLLGRVPPALTVAEYHPVTPLPKLGQHWSRELVELSAIAPAVIQARGYQMVSWTLNNKDGRRRLVREGFASGLLPEEKGSGLLIPVYRPTGERASYQWRAEKPPRGKDGKPVKYLTPRGHANRLDVHPWNTTKIADPTVPLFITEGIKKADSILSNTQEFRGVFCVLAVSGVYNWKSGGKSAGDWEDVPLKGRHVTLCFDADAATNSNVARAMERFGQWIKSKGAAGVTYLVVPREINGTPVKGADDYFAAGGKFLDLLELVTKTPPNPELGNPDAFADAHMAETVARDVLADAFVWCKALGWLQWTGTVWREVSDETTREAVRQYVIDRYTDTLSTVKNGSQGADTAAIKGWHSMLSAGRLSSVLNLARGIAERQADEFDADPDLLNTPSAIVHLATGAVSRHDPDKLMTKITKGSYRPGHTHPDWIAALEALPLDKRIWYQARIGQAITGHPTPDGIVPVLQGTGDNGKSALSTDGLIPALGDYASAASPKLITAVRGTSEHPTEIAELRGKRLVISEEMTEDRALDVTTIKRIQDVGQLTARRVHKDNMTFPASHSLFATSNYLPVVSETDHGTWRRLALLRFPYRFRRPGQPNETRADRPGDPTLKVRIKKGADGQHDAIVTWAVEGAMVSVVADGARLLPPPSVEQDTTAWRAVADRILGYTRERLVWDPAACILAEELLADFNEWLTQNRHKEWSRELFAPRFGGHFEVTRHGVESKRIRPTDKAFRGLRRRPLGLAWPAPKPLLGQMTVWLGVRYRNPCDQHGDDPCAECAERQGSFA